MLFNRQKILLGLLNGLGGNVSNTDFQKWLFLFTREMELDPSFDFVPYRFGCFSFTSYADKRKLADRGFLTEEEHRWIQTDESVELPVMERHQIRRFAEKYGTLQGDALIREVYTRYPETAWRSEILDRVIDDVDFRKRIDALRPEGNGPGLATIGYEGQSVEAYLNKLLADGVTLLCDVRRNPLSRKYGFSKKSLSAACTGVGIRYEHLRELGIDSAQRKGLSTQADYDALFAVYESESLPHQSEAVQQISTWILEGERVALTCFEHLPEQCHRHCVAEAVQRSAGAGLEVAHL
jgi:hypothetical protein